MVASIFSQAVLAALTLLSVTRNDHVVAATGMGFNAA
jgi:hypothetical protein